MRTPAIVTLGILAALLCALVFFETVYWRDGRRKLRTP